MRVKNNPFTHKIYSATWNRIFRTGKEFRSFLPFDGLQFYKSSLLPVFVNLGRNHTKGISYNYRHDHEGTGHTVFLIYDVAEYFEQEKTPADGWLKKIAIRQYPGYFIELGDFKDLSGYMSASFSKSSRYKLNKYKKRFEQSFDVSYTMYHGEMDTTTYDLVFKQFRLLLEKRFDEKQITNNNLDPDEWQFYEAVTYPMILEKKAALFVVYDGEQPIAITLNFLSESILFDAITVFDIDYGKFHLGSVSIMGLIEWCIANNIKILDFSKGEFDYKARWSTRKYDFYYQVYYNPKSIISTMVGSCIANYFRLKQFLREKKVNEKLHRLTYRLRNRSAKAENALEYEFQEVTENPDMKQYIKVDWTDSEFIFLKPAVFNFLYLNGEARKEFTLFKFTDEPNSFLLKGKSTCMKVSCNTPYAQP